MSERESIVYSNYFCCLFHFQSSMTCFFLNQQPDFKLLTILLGEQTQLVPNKLHLAFLAPSTTLSIKKLNTSFVCFKGGGYKPGLGNVFFSIYAYI